jgi:hypothetical protein
MKTRSHPNRQELEELTAKELNTLRRELGPAMPDEQITIVGRQQFERIVGHATVTDFVPLLVYRSTKAALLADQANSVPKAA